MPINFNEAIPIAVLGLIVNVASVLLLSGGGHDHGHGHMVTLMATPTRMPDTTMTRPATCKPAPAR